MMPPAWSEMSRARRTWETLGGPTAWGTVCGLLLAVSAPLYLAGTVVAILGGIGAGMQHSTLRGALVRAAVGGSLFGLAVLLGYMLSGGYGAEVDGPYPAIELVAFRLLPAFPLHWLGCRLASRRRRGPDRQRPG